MRNRLKVESTIANAARDPRARAASTPTSGSFVGGEPLVGRWTSLAELPAETDLSRALSRDLKRRGFRFVGPTVCYSFMQAVGLVNDHTTGCFRFRELVAMIAPIRYARSGDVNIAYQVTGDGPFDLVLVQGFFSHLEIDWEHPELTLASSSALARSPG